MKDKPSKSCSCGLPEKWAIDPEVPIIFNAHSKSYLLKAGSTDWSIRFCFLCGGSLPEPDDSKYVHEMDDEEKSRIMLLIGQIDTLEEILKVLGNADNVINMPATEAGLYSPAQPATKWHQYFRRWKTIQVNFGESPSGKLEVTLQGKPKSVDP